MSANLVGHFYCYVQTKSVNWATYYFGTDTVPDYMYSIVANGGVLPISTVARGTIELSLSSVGVGKEAKNWTCIAWKNRSPKRKGGYENKEGWKYWLVFPSAERWRSARPSRVY
jgi:hypothetical protein